MSTDLDLDLLRVLPKGDRQADHPGETDLSLDADDPDMRLAAVLPDGRLSNEGWRQPKRCGEREAEVRGRLDFIFLREEDDRRYNSSE